jgi:receptor protein-tyrosine kinase
MHTDPHTQSKANSAPPQDRYSKSIDDDEPEAKGELEQRPLGQILADLGKLRHKDIDKVLRLQNRRGLRFGEAACKLRLVRHADLQQALAIQFGYPCLQSGDGQLSAELVSAYRPFSKQGEALRDLRSQLLLSCFNQENGALAIVSPRPRDGRSFAAANLAISFAQWGRKTLLIDADLRTPKQHTLFNLDNKIGLSGVLRGRDRRKAIKTIPAFANLDVLPAGSTPPNPIELVGRPEFMQLLDEAQQTYNVVIVDTPAAANCADAQVIAAQTANALLIARKDVSRLDELQELIDRVSSSGTQVVGAALNRY